LEPSHKNNYIGFDTFELGIYDAVAAFNIGAKSVIKIYERLGFECGHYTIKGCSGSNRIRLKDAGYRCLNKLKVRRKIIRGQKKSKGDKQKSKEGKVYGNGDF